MNTVTRQQSIINGHSLSYLSAGDPADPVALFVHGIPASAELWRNVISAVAEKGYHCVAPDLPGYGKTRMQAHADYSVKGAAQLLNQWVQQQQWSNVWLIAHDIGGGVAQLMMTDNEALFDRVVLSNCITANTWPVPMISLMSIIAKCGLFKPMASMGLFPNPIANYELNKTVVNRAVLNKETKSRIFWDDKAKNSEGRSAFQAMLKSLNPKQTLDNMPALSNVKLPVHLIWAMQDKNQAWDNSGQILAKTLSNHRVTKIENVDHFLQIDNPQAYLDALLT